MDKINRKDLKHDLKHDLLRDQVQHSVEFATDHRSQVFKIGGAVLGLFILGFAIYFYMDYQQGIREGALRQALKVQQAQISPGGQQSEFVTTFPTQAAKEKETEKVFNELASKYSGSKEAAVAHFYLGAMYSDQGKSAEAEKEWKIVADSGDKAYSSQAKFSLAQLYDSLGRSPEAEKLLRDLVANPTIMVSKEQATIALARVLGKSKPDEARKLLEPLRTERSAISRTAITALGEIPAR